jgi:hypothetical protein
MQNTQQNTEYTTERRIHNRTQNTQQNAEYTTEHRIHNNIFGHHRITFFYVTPHVATVTAVAHRAMLTTPKG